MLGNPDAVVAYHAASRVDAFADALLRNRLAVITAGAGEEPRVGLLIGADELAPARIPLAELDARDAARLLALCETLGAWDLLRDGRIARSADGRLILPPFVPAHAGRLQQARRQLPRGLPARAAGSLRRVAGRPSAGELPGSVRALGSASPSSAAAISELAEGSRRSV